MVEGRGDDDNQHFEITGGQLLPINPFDYEAQSTFSVRVRSTDSAGEYVEQDFEITLEDEDEPPTGITLDSNLVPENSPKGTVVGLFAAIDQDIGDRHKFTLVEGEGDGDNANFSISGNSLKTVLPFDYEFQRSHTIRVRAEDSAKLAFESVFEIEVDQVNEPPSAIYLVKDTIEENLPKDTLVGPLVAPDPDNIPADGLILRYTFDDPESLGTESVNNRHAQVHGNVTSVEGKIHGAASFPGDKASYMEVPSFEFGGPVSISTWVRYQKFNSWSRVMDFGNGAGQDNLILANVSSGAGVAWDVRRNSTKKYLRTGSFAKGNWTHVVTTVHESGQLQLFLDGLLVGTNNSGHAPRTLSRSHQLIGLSNWSKRWSFSGGNRRLHALRSGAFGHGGGADLSTHFRTVGRVHVSVGFRQG